MWCSWKSGTFYMIRSAQFVSSKIQENLVSWSRHLLTKVKHSKVHRILSFFFLSDNNFNQDHEMKSRNNSWLCLKTLQDIHIWCNATSYYHHYILTCGLLALLIWISWSTISWTSSSERPTNGSTIQRTCWWYQHGYRPLNICRQFFFFQG